MAFVPHLIDSYKYQAVVAEKKRLQFVLVSTTAFESPMALKGSRLAYAKSSEETLRYVLDDIDREIWPSLTLLPHSGGPLNINETFNNNYDFGIVLISNWRAASSAVRQKLHHSLLPSQITGTVILAAPSVSKETVVHYRQVFRDLPNRPGLEFFKNRGKDGLYGELSTEDLNTLREVTFNASSLDHCLNSLN